MRAFGIVVVLTTVFGWLTGCSGSSGLEIMPLEDRSVRVNNTILVDLLVRDAQGDEQWSFSAPSIDDIQARAGIFQSGPSAAFRWSPLASHTGTHQFTFTVESGNDSDSETINIEVMPAGGAPQFLLPAPGGAYNLGEDPCIEVDIQVLDEDSLQVAISERSPQIEGGEIDQADSFRARWRWCPTQAQIDSSLSHTLRLEANDDEHPPVPRNYEILLLTEEKPDCPGTAPQITSVSAAERMETIQDYEVTATVTDDQGLKEEPILFYTTEQPDTANPDVTQMDFISFEPVGGGGYSAHIPNLNLSVGEERTVYFVVRAMDNDDTEGTACDHTARSEVGQFVAFEPEVPDMVGYCARCSADRQCAEGFCVATEPSFCGLDCGAGCEEGTCQEVTSRGGASDEQCVPEELRCSGLGPCTNDGQEPANDDMETAPQMTLGVFLEGMICPDDFDVYSIQLVAGIQYFVTATGWDATLTDIDVLMGDPEGFVISGSAGSTDVETFEVCSEFSGDHFLVLYGYSVEDQGPYLVEVTEGAGQCCVDDPDENNDTIEEAPIIECGMTVEATICPGDDDYWAVCVEEPSQIEVAMVCDAGEADFDLYVYDETGRRLEVAYSSSCDEEIVTSLPAEGCYAIRVDGVGVDEGDYLLDCTVTAGGGCTGTIECPPWTVCDDAGGCTSDLCDDPGSPTACPSGHFCPDPGGIEAVTTCVDTCTSSSECRSGYGCKSFEEGRGCGLTGLGLTGQPCEAFWDCDGERTCLSTAGVGYCAEINCTTTADCPSDDAHTGPARCVNVGAAGENICLMDCWDGESLCDINPGTCTFTLDMDEEFVMVCALPEHEIP